MSYAQVTREYFEPIDPYYPDWKQAPFPGWGQRPEVAGPMYIATNGLGADAPMQPSAIDLADPVVMKELRSLIGLEAGDAKGMQPAFVENPLWDDQGFMLFALAVTNAITALKRKDTLDSTLQKRATIPYPNSLGVLLLGQALRGGTTAELAKAFPRIATWMKTCSFPDPISCITLPPKFAAPGTQPPPADKPAESGVSAGAIALGGAAVLAGGFVVYKLFQPKRRSRSH